jgi:peroxiredoxin Q/BCP
MPALTAAGKAEIALSDYHGASAVVVYFYPKDDTPGCTKEACSFRDLSSEFSSAGAVVLGVSPDSTVSHEKFASKHHLPFPLLSDPDHAVADAYGVWKEKKNYGKVYMGIERTTVVIDKDGIVRKIFPRVKVDQHAEKVLECVASL